MQKRYFYWSIIVSTFLLAAQVMRSEVVLAHQGHAGPTKIFMNEREALKTMLPEGGKIVKRKEVLKKEKYKEAVKRWGYSPAEGVYSYYISKGKGGELLGVLFIQSMEYKHGNVELAVAYDKEGRITGITILSCPEKFVKEVTENIQEEGFLDKFVHLKTDEAIVRAKDYDKESPEGIRYLVAKEVKGTAILLKLFQGF